MSAEENKALVRRTIEILNKEIWADLLRAEWPDPDTEAFIQEHAIFRAAFTDYEFIIDDLIAEGDKVVLRGTIRATHQGEYPFDELKGIAPTGKRLEWETVWIERIQNGKRLEFWSIRDGVSRLQQLGVLPPPV